MMYINVIDKFNNFFKNSDEDEQDDFGSFKNQLL